MMSVGMIMKGILMNFFVTFMSCLIPLGVGVGMVFLCRINSVTRRVIKAVSQITESISPVVLLLFLFYNGMNLMRFARDTGSMIVMICTFTVCFLGYFPARYRTDYSVGKNIVVNVLGLFADIFKWSLVVGYIGVADLLRTVVMRVGATYDVGIIIVALVVSFSILIVINGVKYLLEEKMR